MKLTNREVISNIKKIIKEVNADSKLSNKFAYSLAKKHARWLIHRESEKLKLIKKDSIYQRLKCVEVIDAPAIDPCCGIKSLCTVKRTKDKIPSMYEDSMGALIKTINTIDSQTSLISIKASDWERKQSNPWIPKNNKNKYFFYSDGHIYFPNGAWKKVEIVAYFEEDISHLNKCDQLGDCKEDCVPFLDREFRLPEYIQAELFANIKKDLMESYSQLPEKSHNINKNDLK